MTKGKTDGLTIEEVISCLTEICNNLIDGDIKDTLKSTIVMLKKYEPFLCKNSGFRFDKELSKKIKEYDSSLQISDISWKWAKELSKDIDKALEPYTPSLNNIKRDATAAKTYDIHDDITSKPYFEYSAKNDDDSFRDAVEHFFGNFEKPSHNSYLYIKEGDIIKFGTYQQGDNSEEKPIEWLVLKKDGNKFLVISKYALDCMKYHRNEFRVDWEHSDIRKWLNDYFYDRAIPTEEQSMIVESYVSKNETDFLPTSTKWITRDKIFLLSINEAKTYFNPKENRRCAPTYFAKNKGVQVSDMCSTTSGEPSCWWWLRAMNEESYIPSVYADGGIDRIGRVATDKSCAVRPAMWIAL